ncbi:ComF family protein [Pontibacter akesuensis]|uniref:ComF family protein n=1 Tax=Pontibacter akesuensis TaxID=388950 RepID=A0A1I7I1I2_9BACT|nr:phosphoribosyltransferase family protein [Pontibacter akesuensis]GHA64722.1 amidophosphoribosyltransferase [Pontibacter akesuensis]SFU66813.1 comF family protein [Pontibacter akesuensis]
MFKDLLNLLFPESCYACTDGLARGEKYICTSCSVKLPYTNFHAHGDTELNPLQRRFWGKVPVQFAFSYLHFVPKGRVQRLLHQLKYKGAQELGEHLGQRYGSLLSEHKYNEQFEVVVPVPLHENKLRRRGYNQAACFARGLGASMNLPCREHALTRTMATDTQTRKNRLDRWQNVEHVFAVAKPELVQGKHVLLVDDVVTTGATLEACARALLAAGAAEVSVAAIAAA